MVKTVMAGNQECVLKSSAAVPRMYRLMFNRDLFRDLAAVGKEMEAQQRREEAAKEEAKKRGIKKPMIASEIPVRALETFENIAFVMAKHADPKQPANIEDWLAQFEMFDIYEIMPQIMEMWQLETEQIDQAKKKTGQ